MLQRWDGTPGARSKCRRAEGPRAVPAAVVTQLASAGGRFFERHGAGGESVDRPRRAERGLRGCCIATAAGEHPPPRSASAPRRDRCQPAREARCPPPVAESPSDPAEASVGERSRRARESGPVRRYVVEVPFHGGPRRVLQGLTSQSAATVNLLLLSVLSPVSREVVGEHDQVQDRVDSQPAMARTARSGPTGLVSLLAQDEAQRVLAVSGGSADHRAGQL